MIWILRISHTSGDYERAEQALTQTNGPSYRRFRYPTWDDRAASSSPSVRAWRTPVSPRAAADVFSLRPGRCLLPSLINHCHAMLTTILRMKLPSLPRQRPTSLRQQWALAVVVAKQWTNRQFDGGRFEGCWWCGKRCLFSSFVFAWCVVVVSRWWFLEAGGRGGE